MISSKTVYILIFRQGNIEEVLPERIELMTNLLIAIMNLSKFEIVKMEEVARKLGRFDVEKIRRVVKILKKYRHSLRKDLRD